MALDPSLPVHGNFPFGGQGLAESTGLEPDNASFAPSRAPRRRRAPGESRSRSRRNPRVWKKLLWVKQSRALCPPSVPASRSSSPLDPDNYTDPPTFLARLRRNHRVVPYDFWPLVADSTVIVQHVCSVAVFVCCFVGIYQARVEPVAVVGTGSAATALGWLLWDAWSGDVVEPRTQPAGGAGHHGHHAGDGDASEAGDGDEGAKISGLGLSLSAPSSSPASRRHTPNQSTTALGQPNSPHAHVEQNQRSVMTGLTPTISPKNQQRLATIKSAILIYCALLGLSPILMSLTKSTTSDSIWAISSWLMLINVCSFDYGSGPSSGVARSGGGGGGGGGSDGVRFPASLSTNAALMASTVLASRLAGATPVFSLTLFSIEVFGLFPVFRRHLRQRSWAGHVLLTVALIGAAGAALGVTLVAGQPVGGAAVGGALVWGCACALAMGGCSWWLIGLQKYKNVVAGPWDPARPVIRAGNWD